MGSRTLVEEPINRPQQVVLANMSLKRELAKQRRLSFLPRSHHRQSCHSLRELNQPLRRRSGRSSSTEPADTGGGPLPRLADAAMS